MLVVSAIRVPAFACSAQEATARIGYVSGRALVGFRHTFAPQQSVNHRLALQELAYEYRSSTDELGAYGAR